MGTISIFNYEIFYLDYLEGKLGEDDVRMLMEFFESHPECKLDDEDLPMLSVENDYVFQGKASLKQTDDKAAVTSLNAEHFMIMEAEGIISDDKKEELNQVVAGDANLEKDRKRYGAVYFAPDTAIVFQNKAGLKRKKAFVLWPYISAGIAAAIISFVFLMNTDRADFGELTINPVTEKNPVTPKEVDPKSPSNNNRTLVEENPVEILNASNVQPYPVVPNKPNDKKPLNDDFEPLTPRMAHDLGTSFDKKKLLPISKSPDNKTFITPNDENNTIVADSYIKPDSQSDVSSMSNPIQPITSFISKKTNKDVDFGTRKATKGKKGGFHVKIGKFQLSRNKH